MAETSAGPAITLRTGTTADIQDSAGWRWKEVVKGAAGDCELGPVSLKALPLSLRIAFVVRFYRVHTDR